MSKQRDYAIEAIIFILFATSSFAVIQFGGRELFLYLQIIFVVFMFLKCRDIVFFQYININLMFAEIVLCSISAIISEMPFTYKKAAVVMGIYFIPLYFCVSYVCYLIKSDNKIISIIIWAIKAMCIVQFMWIPLQYITYHFLHIDINDKIFHQIFHFVENATFIRDWRYYPSGLTWHSALIAPLFVIGFVIFENSFVRLLILLDSLICGSSTSVVGVLICIITLIIFQGLRRDRTIEVKRKKIYVLLILLVVGIVGIYKTNIDEVLIQKMTSLVTRITMSSSDASTDAHFSYYLDYPKVVHNSTIFQILFGYGTGCSGYTATVLYDRYASHSNWAVECDVMNILISRGVVGFVLYYYFLFYIALKGLKIDYRYFVIMIAIIVEGIGYNVQWDYVFVFELVMYFTIRSNINLFDYISKKRK